MRDDKEKLEKILDSIDRVLEYTQGGKEAFFTDRKTQDAVVRNLQVIGEAIKDLSDDLKGKNQAIEWRKASRMRDKITHDYFDVNYQLGHRRNEPPTVPRANLGHSSAADL